MKILCTILLILSVSMAVMGQSEYYYWYKNKKQPLNLNPNKKFVLMKDQPESIKNARIRTFSRSNELASVMPFKKASFEEREKYWTIVQSSENIDKLLDSTDLVYESPFFTAPQGSEMGVSHLFYVKLKQKSDVAILEEMARKHHVEIIGNNEGMPLWYTLCCTEHSSGNALEMANAFYESRNFQAAEPNFMVGNLLFCTNDTYFDDQWGLKNTGQYGGTSGIDINACDAWDITTGDTSVITAVVDAGIDPGNYDLDDNLREGTYDAYDTESGLWTTSVYHYHGTCCAGIIGAETNNNRGIAGINRKGKLMSISNKDLPPNDTCLNTEQELADGINKAWQHGADIISNSWGASGWQSSLIDDAIDSALTYGRNGKGCVVVFAAGNGNNDFVSSPANSRSDILAVGAMTQCGERANPNSSCANIDNWGSNFGDKLDIVAPGYKISTTDLFGSAGLNSSSGLQDYDSLSYTKHFNGTSAACPHVSGVAGLMLSVNSALTQKEVANILESTAQKVNEDTYTYQTTQGKPNGTWNNEMGYGLVDAYCAVHHADPLDLSGGTLSGTYNRYFINVSDKLINDGASVTFNASEVTINGTFEVKTGAEFQINSKNSFTCD